MRLSLDVYSGQVWRKRQDGGSNVEFLHQAKGSTFADTSDGYELRLQICKSSQGLFVPMTTSGVARCRLVALAVSSEH